jgi:EAL domain-containing protein (putative c-di-GMP-specific phosphodiesterase class I)
MWPSILFLRVSGSFGSIRSVVCFAPNALNAANSAAFVSGIITIERSLGLTVIAEGVETKNQLELYQSKGCSATQGYYYSRPVDADTITHMLQRDTLLPKTEEER